MSKTVGVIMILAGMGMASSLLAIGSDAEQVPGKPGSADNPSIVAAAQAKQAPERASPPTAAALQPAPKRAAPPPATFSAPVVVTLPYRAEPVPPPAQQKVARMPRDRASLARDLQLELRRVGCYGG